MFHRLWALAIKELLTLLRDPRSRFIIIGPPLIQLLVFGFAATFDIRHIAMVVVDEDHSHASRQLVARFVGDPWFDRVATLQSPEQARIWIDEGKAMMILRVAPQFEAKLLGPGNAPVEIIIDGRNSNTAALVMNDAGAIIQDFNQSWLHRHGSTDFPAKLLMRAWYNPNLESRWFILPGIVAVLTLVITLLITGLSVAREREMGTFDQLLMTPLEPFEILAGKALPALLIGTLEALFISVVAIVGFHIPFTGSLWALMVGLWLYMLAGTGIGLMISSLAQTQQQGLLGMFMFMVPAIILSGFATPLANMPVWIQDLTLINPLRYFLIIVRAVFLEGYTVHDLITQYLGLALIALVTMWLAMRLFKRSTA